MKFFRTIIYFLLVILACACSDNSKPSGNGGYSITCIADKQLGRDSATLYIIEDSYNSIAQGELKVVKPGNAMKWNGHIDGARAAFIRWQGDSVPFFFVIEPGEIHINIHADRWMIEGGRYNNQYLRYLNNRRHMLDMKDSLFKEYMKHASDSTLTKDMETRYAKRDSLITDSLMQYTAWRMSTGDPVAIIVKERFFSTLTRQYQTP